MWKFIHKFASPKYFYNISGKILPPLGWTTLALFVGGLAGALFLSPPDYQQGESVRIIYIHVPAAMLSMSCYVAMAVTAAIGLIWRIKLADIVAWAIAPIGMTMTIIALITGSVWGKPMWGTYWVWDARLTSELILLFLYLGFIALQTAIEDTRTAARASAILALVGLVNIPIIKYSVNWWNTLHQPATISKMGKPSIDASMLWPLLVMIAAYMCYFAWLTLKRARCEVVYRERNSSWVKKMVGEAS